eukprot:CAMPEP_0114267948 /NCGR_PEP_ID=MMETSP0058-20121206/25636_1 /TAXON_ID=36894 /ORGANISM="Pyramimonas parkeae, CCMP726" /LENGTH=109 /DNA_ID=CAMNT_0001385971 /DNA_START=604 /DNA_END=933 /DNA_ORIENTATION=-
MRPSPAAMRRDLFFSSIFSAGMSSPSPMIDAGEKILIASATSARLQACMCSNRDARPATGIGVGTTGSGSCRVSIAGTPGGACGGCKIAAASNSSSSFTVSVCPMLVAK